MLPEEQGGGSGTPSAQETQEELPSWLQYIPEGEREDAKGHILRQRDYTKKTQEIAPLRKIKEQYGDRDLEKEIRELDEWRQWRRTSWPGIEQRMTKLDDLETLDRQADKSPASDARPNSKIRKFTPDDFLEQDRLETALDDLEERAAGRAMERWTTTYQQQELPRLDRVAQNYLNTVVELLRVVWPKDTPSIDEVLRYSVASQDRNFLKVIDNMRAGREVVKKEGYDDGYSRGLKEGEEKSRHSAPPAGGSVPAWKRPVGSARKDRSSLFNDVMKDVESRKGSLPY